MAPDYSAEKKSKSRQNIHTYMHTYLIDIRGPSLMRRDVDIASLRIATLSDEQKERESEREDKIKVRRRTNKSDSKIWMKAEQNGSCFAFIPITVCCRPRCVACAPPPVHSPFKSTVYLSVPVAPRKPATIITVPCRLSISISVSPSLPSLPSLPYSLPCPPTPKSMPLVR